MAMACKGRNDLDQPTKLSDLFVALVANRFLQNTLIVTGRYAPVYYCNLSPDI